MSPNGLVDGFNISLYFWVLDTLNIKHLVWFVISMMSLPCYDDPQWLLLFACCSYGLRTPSSGWGSGYDPFYTHILDDKFG